MISIGLARRLRAAGLRWEPALGDRFVMPDRDMDDDIFVISNMTVDVHEFPEGRVIGFNGTVEWALDSVEVEEALWLPSEEQLRERLGSAFRGLERLASTYAVRLDVGVSDVVTTADTAEEAYGQALLFLATGELISPPERSAT